MNCEQLVAANSDLFSIHYRGIEFDADDPRKLFIRGGTHLFCIGKK